jgi:RNA polymerase sigma-70 factor, ECF subfamily
MGRNEKLMHTTRVEHPLKKVSTDNQQEFQRFYQENLGLIYHYVYSQVSNRQEAEDLTSHIFLKVVTRIDYERSQLSIKKWLFVVARSIIADYWRAHYRSPKSSLDELLEAGWEGPVEEEVIATSRGAEERVRYILLALPQRYREVLECRFLLKLSIKATALEMGVTETNAKILQYRALKRAAVLEQIITEKQNSFPGLSH